MSIISGCVKSHTASALCHITYLFAYPKEVSEPSVARLYRNSMVPRALPSPIQTPHTSSLYGVAHPLFQHVRGPTGDFVQLLVELGELCAFRHGALAHEERRLDGLKARPIAALQRKIDERLVQQYPLALQVVTAPACMPRA